MFSLEDAIDFLDLESWLSEYVGIKSGGYNEIRLEICPKCAGDDYKLYVNVEKKKWICFHCNWGTQLADVTILMSEVSGRTTFEVRKELLEIVRPAPVGDLVQQLQSSFTPQKITEPVLPAAIVLPGDSQFTGIVGAHVLQYAGARGLTEDELRLYQLRVSLRLRRFMGPFLVFPINYCGVAVGWQGRRIMGDSEPKYVSSDMIADWLWPIDSMFATSIKSREEVTLVEGVFDAIGIWRLSFPAVCTFGKKISDKQVKLLRELGVRKVKLMWDADATELSTGRGLRGDVESAALRLKRYFDVSIVDLSDPPQFANVKKADPGESLRHKVVADFLCDRIENAIDTNSSEFFQWRIGG